MFMAILHSIKKEYNCHIAIG